MKNKSMTTEDKACISFGDFIHDNYYGLQGGWRQYFPVKFDWPLTTIQVYKIYVEYCKNLKDGNRRNS